MRGRSGDGADGAARPARPDLTARATALADLLDQILRAVNARGYTDTLNPAQWSALRFLGRVGAGARTLTGFARFHSSSKAAASQTLSALERKGLVVRVRDLADRRVMRLDLSEHGRTLLQRDPLLILADALASLEPDQLDAARDAIDLVARATFRRLAQ